MEKTIQQYERIMEICREIFLQKMQDYGTAWRILRPRSITDQLFIKAQRIRSFEETGVSEIDEDSRSGFIGVVNYAIMGIIQLTIVPSNDEMDHAVALKYYNQWFEAAKKLMTAKNMITVKHGATCGSAVIPT